MSGTKDRIYSTYRSESSLSSKPSSIAAISSSLLHVPISMNILLPPKLTAPNGCYPPDVRLPEWVPAGGVGTIPSEGLVL